ncbi:ankyrin repeat domain-containing protein [Sodalis ligni]|uniref:ankyrin repeat domain-containing protein n=1 Tax=Sodalis ligni TaxID=2697027 RepID=UPI001BDE65F8|nr:ankyrin repeat domain-containing protein [Sodalis ligni]QWA10448.1 ankyrin repeat domain-containing protein [Sodalis ligni]
MALRINSLLINEKNNSGTTSLMLAAAKGWATVVMDLLEHEEIHFDATDKNGHTALKIAVDNKHDTVIQIFESYKITFDNLKKKSAITKDYLSDANVPSGVPPKWRRVS